MESTIRLDLHLHSDCSDGYYSPEALALRLADAGIYFAALTDHQNTVGQEAFSEAFSRQGGHAIMGLELFTVFEGRDVHLLAYGFEPNNPTLLACTKERVELEQAIAAIHDAGGLAIVAHPVVTWGSSHAFEAALPKLKELAIDGIEAVYGTDTHEERERLIALADDEALLVTGGSDFHGPSPRKRSKAGVELERRHWHAFRQRLVKPGQTVSTGVVPPSFYQQPQSGKLDQQWFRVGLFLPVLVAIGHIVAVIFGLLLPAFEENLLARKRDTIRELTNSAWSILKDYEEHVQAGLMTREQAQVRAIDLIRHLRYGKEGKDYFWIIDMHPRMVMHPYRPELEGHDLSAVADPNGIYPFVEFVKTVRSDGKGYVDYVWQWKDDPTRLATKESYVRGFPPWQWVIGTGIYLADEHKEIAAIESRLVHIAMIVVIVVGFLLAYIVWQSMRIERKRRKAVFDLEESHERYRALVEATTEGTVMFVGNRCAYANQAMLDMLGCSAAELSLLDAVDVFPQHDQRIEALFAGTSKDAQFETTLRRRDGSTFACLLAATRVSMGETTGLVVVIRDLSRHKEMEARLGESIEKYQALAEGIDIGVFRAQAGSPWPFIETNSSARQILGGYEDLESVFTSSDERERFFANLEEKGAAKNVYLQLRRPQGLSTIAISAVVVRNEDGEIQFCDGVLEDVTERHKSERQRESLINQLQTSLLFLNEPIRNTVRPLVSRPLTTTIAQAAQAMNEHGSSAVALVTDDGTVAGILTDCDFRSRVVAAEVASSRPALEIMSAPVICLSEHALVYEALFAMHEKNVRHLVVRDDQGNPVGLAHAADLNRFHQYSSTVLIHEIRGATSVEEVTHARERVPTLVKALIDSGARPRGVAHVVTAVSDAVVERLIRMALDDLGPAPVPFAFTALGSEGREEQTLVTDQDNAIIYEAPPASQLRKTEEYFELLGTRICNDLAQVGYAYCKGNTMASNPRWRRSLKSWQELFTEWIATPDEKNLIGFSIFFDFRCVFGEQELLSSLRRHIDQTLHRHAPFFFHLARFILQHRVPLNLFGQVVPNSDAGDGKVFDIKEATKPFVNYARLYALRHGVVVTNTLDRLQALADGKFLHSESVRAMQQAYDFLQLLRYRRQVPPYMGADGPANTVLPERLSEMELTLLEKALGEMATLQKAVGIDYPGAS